jgi:rhomboid protease GluP
MPPPSEKLLRVLDACRRHGVFHPRVDAAQVPIDRADVDAALDQLRVGGFIEIADWLADKGQGYRLTTAGEAALADPRLLTRPAVPQAPAVERTIRVPDDRWASVYESLIHPRPAIVTWILIAINIAVFLYEVMLVSREGNSVSAFLSGTRLDTDKPIDFGQLIPFRVVGKGQWWRLVSYMFLHANLLHIGCNMFSLAVLGSVMEARLGWWRYLILYFGSGLIGGLAVMAFAPDVPVLGASGAICGVLTSLAAWAWLLRRYLPPRFVEANLRAVAINLVILVMIGMSMNVSNACHAGGAFAGALLTVPLILLDRNVPVRQRALGAILLAAILLATVAVVVFEVMPRLGAGPLH